MRVRVRVKVRVRVRVRVWAAHRLPRRHEQVDVATGVAPAYKLSYLCGGGVVRQFARRRQALNCHASQSASQSLGKAVSWKEKALIGNSLADGRRVTATQVSAQERYLPLTTYHLPLTAYRLPLTAYRLPLTTDRLPSSVGMRSRGSASPTISTTPSAVY